MQILQKTGTDTWENIRWTSGKTGCEVDFGRRGKYGHGHRIDELFQAQLPFQSSPDPQETPPQTLPGDLKTMPIFF